MAYSPYIASYTRSPCFSRSEELAACLGLRATCNSVAGSVSADRYLVEPNRTCAGNPCTATEAALCSAPKATCGSLEEDLDPARYIPSPTQLCAGSPCAAADDCTAPRANCSSLANSIPSTLFIRDEAQLCAAGVCTAAELPSCTGERATCDSTALGVSTNYPHRYVAHPAQLCATDLCTVAEVALFRIFVASSACGSTPIGSTNYGMTH